MPTSKSGDKSPPPNTVEGLLKYVSEQRKRNTTDFTTDANVTEDVFRPIQGIGVIGGSNASQVRQSHGGYETEERTETSEYDGGDTGFNSGKASNNGDVSYLRPIYREPPASDTSSYQHSEAARESIGSTIRDTLKKGIQPFRDVIKQQGGDKSPPRKKEQKRLSDIEAMKMRPKLIESFKWQCEHVDQFIQATTKGHAFVEIWSTLDTDEIELLVDFMIARAKVNAPTARIVRGMAELMDKIKVGLITLPRAYKTMMIYIERGVSLR